MKLWHDDIRPAPDNSWNFWAKTNREAIWVLLDHQWPDFDEASLDHDLGFVGDATDFDALVGRGESPDGDGVDLCMAIYHLKIFIPKITIHSWNPDGAARMAGILRETGSAVTINPYRHPDMSDKDCRLLFQNWPE